MFQNGQQNPGAFAGSSQTSSETEPAPGEPLTPEAERIVNDVPEAIGGVYVAGEKLDDHETAAAVGALGSLSPEFLHGLISFNEDDVSSVLEEGFDFLADRFESEHWKLTERQSRMLGGPTTQLLSSVWSKVAQMLPAQLAQWCMSMPGLAGFILVSAIVVGPKVTTQIAVSRKRKSLGKEPRKPGPTPVTFRAYTGPVGPIDTNSVQPIQVDHSHE